MMGLAWTYLITAGMFEIGWPVGLKMAQKQVVSQKKFYHRYANYKIPLHFNKLQDEVSKHHKRTDILILLLRFMNNRKLRKLPSWQGVKNAIKLSLKKY